MGDGLNIKRVFWEARPELRRLMGAQEKKLLPEYEKAMLEGRAVGVYSREGLQAAACSYPFECLDFSLKKRISADMAAPDCCYLPPPVGRRGSAIGLAIAHLAAGPAIAGVHPLDLGLLRLYMASGRMTVRALMMDRDCFLFYLLDNRLPAAGASLRIAARDVKSVAMALAQGWRGAALEGEPGKEVMLLDRSSL